MDIPKKTYYSISEVCGFTSLEPHVLRYWESEFSQLRPKKNRAGNRAYRIKDIELINEIKHLLYDEKFTISGARKKLSESPKESPKEVVEKSEEFFEEIAKEPFIELPKETSKPISALQVQLELPLPGEISLCDVKKELMEILKIVKE
ncbi:MAG TPA: MerR family transcriptional regulator [Chitinispirillaceae bacterium]|nr:MerR family transcriptional regulator [Chitinispirillaceae bacterium]